MKYPTTKTTRVIHWSSLATPTNFMSQNILKKPSKVKRWIVKSRIGPLWFSLRVIFKLKDFAGGDDIVAERPTTEPKIAGLNAAAARL
jgi:hypothetical protein